MKSLSAHTLFVGLLCCLRIGATETKEAVADSQKDAGELSAAEGSLDTSNELEDVPIEFDSNPQTSTTTFGNDPRDPSALMGEIQQRRRQRESLFPATPLQKLHEWSDIGKSKVYDATYVDLGLTFTQLIQGFSDTVPGTDSWGTAADVDFIAKWKVLNRDKPNPGNLYFHLETRWNYGTTGPQTIASKGLGSLINTANTFEEYFPQAALIRNVYWEQGDQDSDWAFRIGKITPDAVFGSSPHLTPVTTFLTFAATGAFAMALPDSGLGLLGAYHFNDNIKLLGAVSDANGNRYDFGDLAAGDLFTALELGIKIMPRTKTSGYSKLNIWHTDGTSDGRPSDGMAGPQGWGFFLLHEQEITDDGKLVAVFKGGHGFNDSSYFRSQAGASILLYDPSFVGRIEHDVVGAGFNWADATSGVRDEYNIEVFYRFPMFPGVDTTLSYQAVIDPARDLGIDFASVFSFRIRTVF